VENCFGPQTKEGRIYTSLKSDCEERYPDHAERIYEKLEPYGLALPKLVRPFRRGWLRGSQLVTFANTMLVSTKLIEQMLQNGYAATCEQPQQVMKELEQLVRDMRAAIKSSEDAAKKARVEAIPLLWRPLETAVHFVKCTPDACDAKCRLKPYHKVIRQFDLNKSAKFMLPSLIRAGSRTLYRVQDLPEFNPLAFIPKGLPGLLD